ncbi:hypothetical protein PGTUg99_002582 [Puccinia graminis f. sp. tritici]|uniref:Uncharacterized protein n=1 Tax=Puccinia graminis f. sp. tritici TaxID=56615 RepID=A0A5B0RDC4_PUCGR|nr:hypothetical protein PGTUg99_002582 [Puccinia graminis f. sp. tritici]
MAYPSWHSFVPDRAPAVNLDTCHFPNLNFYCAHNSYDPSIHLDFNSVSAPHRGLIPPQLDIWARFWHDSTGLSFCGSFFDRSLDLDTVTTRMTCDTVNPSLIRFRPNSTNGISILTISPHQLPSPASYSQLSDLAFIFHYFHRVAFQTVLRLLRTTTAMSSNASTTSSPIEIPAPRGLVAIEQSLILLLLTIMEQLIGSDTLQLSGTPSQSDCEPIGIVF